MVDNVTNVPITSLSDVSVAQARPTTKVYCLVMHRVGWQSAVTVRPATTHDRRFLLSIPQYSGSEVFPSREDILIAEKDGKILAAISIGLNKITCIRGEWEDCYEQDLKTTGARGLEKVTGYWLSKLYVLPEYRHKGIGTKLLEESVKYLEDKGITETYAGIYIKNRFRNISHRIFEKNGFTKFGSCICFLSEGYCRGTLLKRLIHSQ